MIASWFDIPWSEILIPRQPIEMVIRGALVYFGVFLILRVVMRRQAGSMALSDLLVTVLIADALSNAMSGDYQSVPDGLILISTIVFCDFGMDYLGFHVSFINRFLNPPPLNLIKNGEMNLRNMRQELVTKDELMTKIREEGIDKIKDVKLAYLEHNGEISVIPKDS